MGAVGGHGPGGARAPRARFGALAESPQQDGFVPNESLGP